MDYSGEKFASQITELVTKDFNLDDDQLKSDDLELADLHKKLEKIIAWLLEHDFERLLNAMYRLDISETKFRAVINGDFGNRVSEKLADLVIEREMEKIKTRAKFRK